MKRMVCSDIGLFLKEKVDLTTKHTSHHSEAIDLMLYSCSRGVLTTLLTKFEIFLQNMVQQMVY